MSTDRCRHANCPASCWSRTTRPAAASSTAALRACRPRSMPPTAWPPRSHWRRSQDYALWMIDARLPDGSGAELLARLRETHPRHAGPRAHRRARIGHRSMHCWPPDSPKCWSSRCPPRRCRRRCGACSGLAAGRHTPTVAPPDDGELPLWDDEAAARGAQRQPRARRHAARAVRAGTAQVAAGDHDRGRARRRRCRCARDLHRLRASCGFVGAARLGAAVQALQQRTGVIAAAGALRAGRAATRWRRTRQPRRAQSPRGSRRTDPSAGSRACATRPSSASISHDFSPRGPRWCASTSRMARRRPGRSSASGRLSVGQRQQRAAGGGAAAVAVAAIAEHAARTVFGIQPVARGRIDRRAVAVVRPVEAEAERFEQVALEAAQRPAPAARRRRGAARACA